MQVVSQLRNSWTHTMQNVGSDVLTLNSVADGCGAAAGAEVFPNHRGAYLLVSPLQHRSSLLWGAFELHATFQEASRRVGGMK